MSPLPRQRRSGADPLLLAGEHRPGAAEAGGDLVGDHEHAVLGGQLPHPAQEPGRLHPDPGRPLDQRLDDHRRDLARVQVEHPLELALVPRVDPVGLEQQRPEGAVEEVDAADRDGAERVAVVAVGEADERGSPAEVALALAPVLKRHLQRDLDRGRSRLGVEDPRETRRRDLDQPRGELGGAGMREPEHGRVGDPVELVAHRRVDQRVPVAVDVAPQRGDAVDVAPALRRRSGRCPRPRRSPGAARRTSRAAG